MGRMGLLGCVGALILVVIIGGIWFIGVRNHIVGLDQTVQGAANFEKSTLVEVVNARARVGQVQGAPAAGGPPQASPASTLPNDPQAMANFAAAQQNLSGALSRLLVVVERYPELKSNQNFLELQSQLEGTENRIAVERRRYNEVAQTYNTAILSFPASMVASFSRFTKKAYFQGVAGSNQAPTVNFDFGTNTAAPATQGP